MSGIFAFIFCIVAFIIAIMVLVWLHKLTIIEQEVRRMAKYAKYRMLADGHIDPETELFVKWDIDDQFRAKAK